MNDALWRKRAYGQIEQRQQEIDRRVVNVGELRRALQAAHDAARPLNVRLGADIVLDGPVTIPTGVPRFNLNGGNLYSVRWDSAITSAFIAASGGVDALFSDVRLSAASEAATAPWLAATVFSSTDGSWDYLRLRNVVVDDCTEVLDPAVSWPLASFVDVVLGDRTAVRLSINRGAQGRFVSCTGRWDLTLGAFTLGDRFIACDSQTGSVDVTASIPGRHTFVGCNFAAYLYGLASVNVFPGNETMRIAAGWASTPASVALTVANETIYPSGASVVKLTLAAGATGNLVLDDGIPGQFLVLVGQSYAGTAVLPSSGASNTALASTWTPAANRTLTLVWDDTAGLWRELARA